MSPTIAFSRDSRFIAAAGGENTVKVWEVISGREVQTLTSSEGGMASSIAGVYFIAFSSNDRLVTISDAIRVWDIPSARVVSTIASETLNTLALMGGEGGVALSLDGNQLARLSTAEGENKVQVSDLATSREVRAVNLPDKNIDSADIAFTPDGHVLVAGIVDKRVKLWDVTSTATERGWDQRSRDRQRSFLDSSNSVATLGCCLFQKGIASKSGTSLAVASYRLCSRLTAVSLPQPAASLLVSVTTGKKLPPEASTRQPSFGKQTPRNNCSSSAAAQTWLTRSRSALTATNFLPAAARVGIYVPVEDCDSPRTNRQLFGLSQS